MSFAELTAGLTRGDKQQLIAKIEGGQPLPGRLNQLNASQRQTLVHMLIRELGATPPDEYIPPHDDQTKVVHDTAEILDDPPPPPPPEGIPMRQAAKPKPPVRSKYDKMLDGMSASSMKALYDQLMSGNVPPPYQSLSARELNWLKTALREHVTVVIGDPLAKEINEHEGDVKVVYVDNETEAGEVVVDANTDELVAKRTVAKEEGNEDDPEGNKSSLMMPILLGGAALALFMMMRKTTKKSAPDGVNITINESFDRA